MAPNSALKLIIPSALVIGLVGFVSIEHLKAQPAPSGEAQSNTPLSPNEPKKTDNQPANTGVDPELVQVNEPDNADLDPSLVAASREEKAPKAKIDDANVKELTKAVGINGKKDSGAIAANGGNSGPVGIMPHLVGANIPVIPVNLLFPQGTASAQVEQSKIEELSGSSVLMLGVDRSTGVAMRFRIPVGSAIRYQNINVAVSACYKSRPENAPESWAYVDVTDLGEAKLPQVAVLAQRNRVKMREDEGPHRLRKGWIIASSPSVTAIDHPVYDISLIACEGGQTLSVASPSTTTDNKDQKKG